MRLLFELCLCFFLLASVVDGRTCPSQTEMSFIETVGSRWLVDLLAESQPSTTTEQCHSACARDSRCAAYVYWPNGNCQLFATAPEPGYLLAQDKDATYFQKCDCDNLARRKKTCGRSFERFTQMVLVGLAEQVLEPLTRDECLAACNNVDFCKSVMFFYNGGDCILNSVYSAQKAHLFSPVMLNDTIADFYETRCEGRWSGWGAWSECSGERRQVRSRVCSWGFEHCRGDSETVRFCASDSSRGSLSNHLNYTSASLPSTYRLIE